MGFWAGSSRGGWSDLVCPCLQICVTPVHECVRVCARDALHPTGVSHGCVLSAELAESRGKMNRQTTRRAVAVHVAGLSVLFKVLQLRRPTPELGNVDGFVVRAPNS